MTIEGNGQVIVVGLECFCMHELAIISSYVLSDEVSRVSRACKRDLRSTAAAKKAKTTERIWAAMQEQNQKRLPKLRPNLETHFALL
jgi:hypothetical protein